jgi:capsular exopolysaccharide synthesis family protein
MLSLLGVLAGLCLLEASGRRVYSSDDVGQGLGLRIVGTLPRLPASAGSKSASAQSLGGLDARYGLTEAVDALRTVLMHSPRCAGRTAQEPGARVVVITSAIGGEGKTTLASHLAASLARAWRKTLLIDGDLRKPAAHGQFDLPLEPGLSEALRGEVEFDDTVKPTMTSRLWLMPAGKLDAHSLQALAQEGLANVFERLREQYDFIVIDTSPVLPVPDALLLAQQADTVLLSVLRDHSRLPAVYAAQQKLEALGIRVLGSVVIGEKTETYGHAVPYPG